MGFMTNDAGPFQDMQLHPCWISLNKKQHEARDQWIIAPGAMGDQI